MLLPVDLLDSDAIAFDAQYRNGLSNHLPMALIALARLGASPTRIAEFRAKYISRLEPAPTTASSLARAELSEHLGTHRAYAPLANMFRALVATTAPHDVVRDALPELVPGLAGGAFHGLIRLAYAVGTPDVPAVEVAAALAYMADVHLAVGEGSNGESRALSAILDDAANDANATSYSGKNGLIFDDLADVASRAPYTHLLNAASTGPRTVEEAARSALAIYASTGNFTALHCVTAAHALRVLSPFIADVENASNVLARAIVTAYITISAPKLSTSEHLDRMRRLKTPGWDEIAAAACASDNEHVIKIAWTARDEHTAYGDPLYAFVAARATGLIPKDSRG